MADGYISQIKTPDNKVYLLKDSDKINSISASGTAPLTLSGSKSGTTYTLTGSVADASASASGVVNTDAQTFSGVKTFDNGLHIYGTISTQGTGSAAGTMYPGGAYHSGHNSIVLHGDTAGISGIGFTSEKATKSGTTTNINSSSDRAFIQYHAYGVTPAAEGTAPTLATSGELGTLVIGVGNDATDTIRLQAPGNAGILHQIGATAYPIPHTTNTNGSVGAAGTPVYVEAGVIKAGTALGASAYHADSYFALASHGTHVTTATVKSALGIVSTTAKKFLKDTGDWAQVAWGDLTGVPSSFAPSTHEHNRLNSIGRLTTAAAIAYNPGASQGFRLVWNIYDGTSRTNDATNSPSFDAGVINLPWDWGGYNGQIAISNTVKDNTRMQIRSASHIDNGESANPRYTPNYGAWREVVTATKATKVGDTNKPVYINAEGQATAISYTIAKSVPSDAKFTDTTYSAASNGGLSLSDTAFSIASGGVTNAMLAGSIANGKLTNSKVTIAGNDVNLGGSLAASTLVTSLGLSKAMRFIGVAVNTITDGGTQDPGISGYSTKTAGDVVIDSASSREYVWSTTSKWELLGGDSSYKTTQTAVTDPTASTSTSTTFIDTISQNANGVITATKKTLPTASSTVAGITKVGASGGAAAYSHTHGNIQNGGTLQTNDITIANGDKLIVTDSSDSAKIARTSISFDGSTATQALTKKGTWETFNNYSHPTGDGNSHVPATSTTNGGKFLKAGNTANSAAWANITHPDIKPTISKTYAPAKSYGETDAEATCSFFFLSVKPDSWYKGWQVRFKVRTVADSYANVDSTTWCTLNGRADSFIYHNWNERYDIGHYYIVARALKSAGFNAGLGHMVGVNVRYSTGRGNTAYTRKIYLDYYDCEGCTVTVLDAANLWANLGNTTNYSDTNYNGYTNLDAVNRGLRETSDDNSTSISHLYEQYGGWVAANLLCRYQFVFENADHKFVSIYGTDNAYGTTNKTLLTVDFDPNGRIFYHSTAGTTAANANIDSGRLYYAVLADLRYSFNVTQSVSSTTFTGVRYTSLYLKTQMTASTGMVHVASNQPLVTTLPTSNDGYYYIYLGQVHDWYHVMMTGEHPVYYHDGNKIVQYIGKHIGAEKYIVDEKVTLLWNSTDNSLDFIFA